MTKLLTLDIVTQEKRLLTVIVKSVTMDTIEGEITVLPGHTPLLTKLSEGILRYTDEKDQEDTVVIFGGFLEIDASGKLTVLADSAVRATDLDEANLQKAKLEAEETLKDKAREVEFANAEASLRRTVLEMKALKRGAKSRHSQH